MSWDLFGRMLADKHARLKPLLMDQKFMAGIGNVYSDEILFAAGLRWDRMSDSLSEQEVRRLYRAISETLQEAVKYRGSSLADEQYVDLFGHGRRHERNARRNGFTQRGTGAKRACHRVEPGLDLSLDLRRSPSEQAVQVHGRE